MKAKQLVSYRFILGRLENTKLHLVGSRGTHKVKSRTQDYHCFVGRTVNVKGLTRRRQPPQHTGKQNQQDSEQEDMFLKGTPALAISFLKSHTHSEHGQTKKFSHLGPQLLSYLL